MTRESGPPARRCLDTGRRGGPKERDGVSIGVRAGPTRQFHGADPWRLHGRQPAGRDVPVALPLAIQPRPDPDCCLQRPERADDPGRVHRQRRPLARDRRRRLDPAGAGRQRHRLPAGLAAGKPGSAMGGRPRSAQRPGRRLLLVGLPPGQLRHHLRSRPRPLFRRPGDSELVADGRPATGRRRHHRGRQRHRWRTVSWLRAGLRAGRRAPDGGHGARRAAAVGCPRAAVGSAGGHPGGAQSGLALGHPCPPGRWIHRQPDGAGARTSSRWATSTA